MAAGLGFKTFTTGEVLTADNVNGYLMQGVLVFASAAARDAAITSPQEGQCCYLKDTDAVLTYSGSAWVGFDDSNAIQNSIVDAKGDIVAASASDTPARLAVGNNGDTLVADSATATGLAYIPTFFAGKNKIINGDMRFNQRGFTSVTTNGFYNFDRFCQINGGTTGTLTTTPQTFTPGAAPVAGYEARNFVQCVTASGASTDTYAIFVQKIESVRTLAGSTATISFWAKAASGTPKIGVELEQIFGTGGSPSAPVNTSAGSVTLSTSWARYSVTIAVPSISGKTIGTAGDDILNIYLWLSAGSTFASRASSIGLQNATFSIWGVQVESGSTATSFQTATGTIQGELAACQRYFCKTFPLATAPASNAGQAGAYLAGRAYGAQAIAYVFYWQFPVAMRAAPTITTYSPSAAGSAWFDEDGAAKTAAVGNTSNNATSIYNSATATPNKNALIHATAEIEL
jgi:hypothetical protein